MTIYLIFILVLSYLVWIKCIYYRRRRTLATSLKQAMNILSSREANSSEIRTLIVTAHPDDECMFFAPTIIRLSELKASVHLLCLSEGNYYNQGTQRKEELISSCAVLGIPASRITIVDHGFQVSACQLAGIDQKLPDDPKAEWSVSLVSAVIVQHIRANSINMVLTFDRRGVSGHANHVAIYKAVSHLASTGQVSNDCCLLSLETVGLLRKYFSFLDLPLSWLLPSCLWCFIGSHGYKQAKAAMLCHRTQLLWFRYLYIIFSRYMFINTFQIIPQGPKNLKIY